MLKKTMTKEDIKKIKELLTPSKNIVITTHFTPDGDAMGSSLGLYHFLIQKKCNINVITPNDYPRFLHWLPGNDKVTVYEEDTGCAKTLIKGADVIFCLDYNALGRLEEMGPLIEKSTAIKILIDHHPQPDNFADYMLVDTKACSTSELIYEFIGLLDATPCGETSGRMEKQGLNKNVANCLYTGIMTDTGSFLYGNTTAKTHKAVAGLLEAGADSQMIHSLIYNINTEDKIRLLGYCLIEKLKVFPEYSAAVFCLSKKELKRFNHKKGDTEGFVNYALSINGIRLSAFIIERGDIVKLSFRSEGDFSVNAFARKHFNGGGHKNAAGGESKLSLKETMKKFISLLPQYAKSLNMQP